MMMIRFDRPFPSWEIGRSGAFFASLKHPLYHEGGAFHHKRIASYRGWDARYDVY
jgi:hypothetical protein